MPRTKTNLVGAPRQRGRIRPNDSCEVQLPQLVKYHSGNKCSRWLMQIHKHLIGSRGWLGVVFESATPGMLPHVKPQWRMEGCPIKTLGTIIGCPATAQGVIALKSLMATQWVAPGQHKVLSQFNSSQRCNLGWGPWEELQEWEDAPEPTPN